MQNLTITVSEADPRTVAVDGQIDSHTATSFNDVLVEIPADQTVHVDLGAVTFIDSSGLRVLVRAEKRQSAGGGALVIANPSAPVRRLLEITGLASELTIVS
ncbi:MAG: STAS domain-containing protein [Actinomycetota bacterium]